MKVNKLEGKVCSVCGDKALGYNFNAITCESCKAFFRRNALLERDFKCPFNQNCVITTITRRFCQKCRLEKCFSIGMCKALIMSEEDKELKRKKIIDNKSKKRMGLKYFKKGFKKMKKNDFSDESSNSSIADSRINVDVLRNFTDDVNAILPSNNDSQKSVENAPSNSDLSEIVNYEQNILSRNLMLLSSDRLVSSSDDIAMITNVFNDDTLKINNTDIFSPESENINAKILPTTGDSSISSSVNELDNINKDVICEEQNHKQGSFNSIINEAIRLEFQCNLPNFQTSGSKELNDLERAKINELIIAHKVLLDPLDDEMNNNLLEQIEKSHKKADSHPDLLDVINLTAIIIRRLIKMAKKINAFKNMCQEDQVALLKGGCTEIMVLLSALNYDAKKQSWAIPRKKENMNLNVDVLKLAEGNAYEEHEKFIKTFEPQWRADENIILIMCAITLFTPDRTRVIHKDVIKFEQNSYYYLLRRYLECSYKGCEAKSTFLKLMRKISELHVLNEELINVYLNVNPSQVEPLLLEIFDLK